LGPENSVERKREKSLKKATEGDELYTSPRKEGDRRTKSAKKKTGGGKVFGTRKLCNDREIGKIQKKKNERIKIIIRGLAAKGVIDGEKKEEKRFEEIVSDRTIQGGKKKGDVLKYPKKQKLRG